MHGNPPIVIFPKNLSSCLSWRVICEKKAPWPKRPPPPPPPHTVIVLYCVLHRGPPTRYVLRTICCTSFSFLLSLCWWCGSWPNSNSAWLHHVGLFHPPLQNIRSCTAVCNSHATEETLIEETLLTCRSTCGYYPLVWWWAINGP